VRRIALAHDWLVGYRGGEAVLHHIARAAGGAGRIAGLYTMFMDPACLEDFPGGAGGAIGSIRPRRVSPLGSLPGANRLRRWLLPLYPRAVADLSRALARDHAREPIDLLVSTSSAAVKGVRAPAGVRHVCYCHTPARYLWSQQSAYTLGDAGRARGVGLRLFGPGLRSWDRRSTNNADRLIANSTHTREQIRRCYGRDATVVFPPVDTAFYTPGPGGTHEGFWLYVGALEPYKRVDLAIDAARLAGARLVIVGTGSQEAWVRGRAAEAGAGSGGRIEVVGRASRERLRELYRAAGVLLFPQVEDFGIVGVEAQACGLPVCALGRGGALDTVEHGVTGVHMAEATPGAMAEGAKACLSLQNVRAVCRRNAERFGVERFEREIDAIIRA
jgi:glycosyltransferase involved in cell wall biosynthesis